MDGRGHASLAALHPTAGDYLGEMLADGTIVLRPAEPSSAQLRLSQRRDVMAAIDELARNPAADLRRGRPRRGRTG